MHETKAEGGRQEDGGGDEGDDREDRMRVTQEYQTWPRKFLGLKPLHKCRICGAILYSHQRKDQKIERLYTRTYGRGRVHFRHRCNFDLRPAKKAVGGCSETHPPE